MESRPIAPDDSRNGQSAAIAGHMAGLAEFGLPLAPGLRALSEEIGDARLRKALQAAAGRIEAGDPLGIAGPGLPAPIRDLLAAGYANGHLVEVVAELGAGRNFDLDLRRRLLRSLAYPLILLLALAVLFSFGVIGIASQFEKIFADFGLSLPAITAFLISITSRLDLVAWRLVPAALGLLFVAYFWWRFALDAAGRARWVRRIPFYGQLALWAAQARFARSLALMIDAGLPTSSAIRHAADLSDDADLQSDCARIADDVDRGMSLAESVGRRRGIDPILSQVMAWSEGKQSLSNGLRLSAEAFEALAREQTDFIGLAANIFIFIIVMASLAFFLAAMFSPMISLLGALAGVIDAQGLQSIAGGLLA